ncbi:MAG: TIGR00730 family Rossman fold protein [Bacteroidetes bacterium]|nr:TIGR00730 family Rossman fold protein [Bacteroidota bacterium]
MNRIAVYCGSSAGVNGIYREQAAQLGVLLASRSIEVVFGGGKVGLMGYLADASMDAGGRVTGIIPGFLYIKEVAHDRLTKMITVETMHERKALIFDMSDGFIALPGGFGTLDELFEMLTWGQLGLHQKPVGILNVNGYFNPILEGIDSMVGEGFLKIENRDMIQVSDRPIELLRMMEQYQAPALPKWIK